MNFNFNANDKVKVKLTDIGIARLKQKYQDLRNEQIVDEVDITLDELGYYEIQLWKLMSIFGDLMYNGNQKLPFDVNLIFVNGTPITNETEEIKKPALNGIDAIKRTLIEYAYLPFKLIKVKDTSYKTTIYYYIEIEADIDKTKNDINGVVVNCESQEEMDALAETLKNSFTNIMKVVDVEH